MIGKITGYLRDYATNHINVQLSIEDSNLNEISKIQEQGLLRIDMKKYKERRSLDANAYFHLLIGKIATELSKEYPTSFSRCKNMMIARYGQLEIIDDSPAVIKSNIHINTMLEQEMLHVWPCGTKEEHEKTVYFYRVYRPTHTYNRNEFSFLLNGVVEEAKTLGIETISQFEQERLIDMLEKRSK